MKNKKRIEKGERNQRKTRNFEVHDENDVASAEVLLLL
jgi:hypothetical protein